MFGLQNRCIIFVYLLYLTESLYLEDFVNIDTVYELVLEGRLSRCRALRARSLVKKGHL